MYHRTKPVVWRVKNADKGSAKVDSIVPTINDHVKSSIDSSNQ